MGQDKQTTKKILTEGPRTINYYQEGGHSYFKNMTQHPHPNIYTLLKYRKEEQVANEFTMNLYQAGSIRPSKPRKYRLINTRLQQYRMMKVQ